MALWDKVRQELEHAGKIAQGALDEGKVRLEAFRARQRADQAAQALGYAVYRARQQGQELDTDTYARLSSTLAGHEAEASRYEARLSELADSRRPTKRADDAPADSPPTAASATAASATAASAAPAADAAVSGDPAATGGAQSSAPGASAPEPGTAPQSPPTW